MKLKQIGYKLVLILLILSLLTPEYAGNVLAATDLSKTVTAGKNDAKPKDVVLPSPTPWNPNTVQKALEQPVPTPTPTPDMSSVPKDVYSEAKSRLPDGLILTPEEAAAYSTRLSTEDSEQARINAIKAKYAKPSLKMKRAVTEPLLSKKDIRELMIQGAQVEDVYEIAYLSVEAGLNPFELLALYTKRGVSWDELRQNLKAKGGSTSVTEEAYGVTDNVYSKLEDLIINPISSFAALSTKSVSTLDMAIASVIDDFKMAAINQVGKPQYSDRNLSSESVDPASGTLTWKDTQISLPGRDGLDLNIGVMYNSNDSEFISDSNIPNLNRNVQYDLGTGWSFRFPSITSDYYHDGEGGTYRYYTDAIHGLEGGFYDYKGKDKRIFIDGGSFSNGDFLSTTYVEYADGKREYFGEPGLLGIVDRFGNTITFKYGAYWHTDNWQSKHLITQIIDSVGRVIDFNYDWINSRKAEANKDLPDENLTITVKDLNKMVSQKVVYTRARVGYWTKKYLGFIDGEDRYYGEWEEKTSPELKSITLQNGEQLKFNYVRGDYVYNTKFKPEKLDIKQNFSYEAGNELLSSIEYPHSRTVYEMGYQARNMGPYGSIDTPIVKTRYDQVLTSGVYSGRYNETTYSYNGSYDGYATYYGLNLVPASHTYSSVMYNVADNLSVTRTFNGKGQFLSAVSQAANGEKKIEKNTVFHSVITQLPTATETWEYGPGDTDNTANKLYSETNYDEWGNVTAVTRPLTDSQRNNPTLKARNTTTFTYESNYHLLSSKSWYASENDSSALSESYTYTAQGRVQTATNAVGEMTSFTYQNAPDGTSPLYKATSEKQAGGKTVARSVVTYGEKTGYAYPTVEEAYFNIGQRNQQIVQTSTAYDMGTGRVTEKKDGEQHATTYTYDAMGRLKQETHPVRTNANGERYSDVTDYNYYNQSSGNFDSINSGTEVLKVDSIRTVTNLSNNSVVKTYANVLYNGLGLALLEEHFDDNVGWVFTQYHYDDMGRPVYSIDPAGNTLSVGYDAWGRQNRATTANGDLYISDYSLKARTNTSYIQDGTTGEKMNYAEDRYDPWGNKSSSLTYKDWPNRNQPISESYRYNSSGKVTGYTDPKNNLNEDGVTTSFVYDTLNRLAAVKDALNQTTNYSYDGNGQLTKVTIQAKGGTPQTLNTKTYNELGLLAVKQDGASQSESYSYNSLGQLISKTDRNGSTFGYAYDESGQLIKSTINGTINNVAQTQETNVIFGKDNPRNQVIQTLTNNQVTATQTQVMDSLGQVRSTYSVGGNHSAFILNQRDVLGRMTQINDSYMGFYTNYQYNKQRLDKIQTNGSSTLTSDASNNVRYSYLANNLVKSITYPTLTDNSILKTEYTYNKALGWIESMSNTKGTSVLSSYSYGYDNNGNRVTVSELRKGSNTAQTTNYGYDALNRLVSITRPDGGKTMYTYDLRGNRQTLSDTSSLSLDTTDTSYAYDLQNTLTSVTKGGSTTSFQYYADGLRYMKTNGNTQTQVNYNLNGQVLSEEKIVGGVYVEQASFVRGDRVLVKKDKKASKDYYYLYNGHGDVVQIVDTNGEIKNNYVFDEWGDITSQKEEISNSFKYTGVS